MNLAELLLRLGCTMVGWMVIYTQLLWLATLRVVGCQSDGDAMWRLLLGFAPVALVFAFTLRLSRPLPAVHNILRWAAAPLVVLIPLALMAVWPTLQHSTLGNQPICDGPVATWHRWWAPTQVLTVFIIGAMAYRTWRPNAGRSQSS